MFLRFIIYIAGHANLTVRQDASALIAALGYLNIFVL
jgi:hypothetical protein